MKTAPEGLIVFLCDDSGKVLKVVQDDLGMESIIEPGVLFSSAVHRDNLGKALNFLLEIRTNGTAVGWEFNCPLGGGIESVHFAGFKEKQSILMTGAKSQKGLLQYFKSRVESKDQSATTAAEGDSAVDRERIQRASESAYFDELTRLYNEISNMHRELAKKNVELERVNALKNQFLGMAAHDLRTSLWTIQMYSQFLVEEIRAAASEEQLRMLQTIMESSENLKNIVGDYLDIATIESGKLQLDLKPTDLLELCKNCIRLNGILAEKKQIRLNLEHQTLPKLKVDTARIEQVLNNLIHNAIKFSPPQTEIRVALQRTDDEVIVCVEDQGVGIPSDKVDILFEPFEGGRTQGTEEEKGSGLGLAIARKVVQEHGGRIWVESEVGEGSKFSVSLPLTPVGTA
jgi:signal transduction histidine kinase